MSEFPSNISDNIRTVAPQGEPCDTALPTNAGRIDLHAVRRDITRANDPAVQGEGRRVVESRVRYAAAALVDEVSQLRVALDETMRERDYARLDVADHDARVRAEERRRLLGELGKAAAHPFKGPDDTDASMLLEAAKRIEGGYVAGGSHTRETTGRVLRLVADMLAASSAVPVATREPSDETRCHRCGGKNCTWSAPSPLWNEVMRGGDINGPWQWNEIICPPCFAELAEAAGIAAPRWRFSAEQVLVPLATSTPTGRVWDEATQLWVEPVATPTEPGKCRHDRMGGCGLDGINEPVAASRDLLGALQASIDRARQEPEPRPPLRVMEAHLMQDCTDPAVCWYEPHRSGARRPAEQDGQR